MKKMALEMAIKKIWLSVENFSHIVDIHNQNNPSKHLLNTLQTYGAFLEN